MNDVPPTLTPEQRIQDILAAYRSAQAAGEPFDLEAVLAREPALAAEVRARLAEEAPAEPAAGERPTLGAVAVTPVPGADSEPTTITWRPGGRVSAPPQLGHLGDYELLEEIARGGMGIVFRAREKSLNRIVALKVIRAGHLATPDEVRRFRLEAEEAGRLDHPNIVPIYHIGEHGGMDYFTMKLIDGGTLARTLTGPSTDLHQTGRLVAAVAHAVHHAHRHGVLHRDIKPSNILIDLEGRPHVTDFGLVKHLGAPAGQTHSGAIVGTPEFMSPEQAAARKDLTTATDIYSLGAVLYALVTGRPPFTSGSSLDTLLKVLEAEPVRPRQLNPRLDRDLETICLTCLHKDPRRRYASAEALALDLERYLAGEPIRARRVGRLERVRKWVRRRPLAAVLAAVLLVAAIALGAGGWVFSVQLQEAVRQAQRAQAVAEEGEREADRKRQQVNDYLVYLNERLANLKVEQPIRLEFLREGLELFEKFRKGGGEDTEARRRTAMLYRGLGDLEQERHEPAKAKEAYSHAQELLEQLAAEFPQAAVYRNDLAQLHARRAYFLEESGEQATALSTLQQAITMQDGLAAEANAPLERRLRAAQFRLSLGTFLEEQKKPTEAETAYRAALERLEKLRTDQADTAGVHRVTADTANLLGWLLREAKPAEAESMLQRCLRERRAAQTAKSDDRALNRALGGAYTDLAAFFRQRGQHAALAALAQQVRGDFMGEPEHSYDAARFLADAVRVVAGQRELPPPQRDALGEGYAAAAVVMLDKAIKEGFANRARFEVDPGLDPLRSRKDFGVLMTELERSHPNLSAEQELASLEGLFGTARNQYRHYMNGARTELERQRALAVRPDLQACADKYLALAQKWRTSEVGMEALVQILETCQADDVGEAATATRQRAAQLLEKDHFQRPELGNVCLRFARARVPEAEALLKKVREQHPQREARGMAGLALAANLARAGNTARKTDPRQAEEKMRQVEQELGRLLQDYGNVPVGRSSLGEYARYELDEVRYLSEGCPARDIVGQDLKGQPLRLSDYRGKVVVLNFWADWCGFCRQMYPLEQELVRRYQDKPFVLLGVNCDDDRDDICHTVARRGLTWSSWWDRGPDGGRICKDWHITGFPTTWVLDHKHVIRYRHMRGKELEEAVAKLVKEAEEEQAKGK